MLDFQADNTIQAQNQYKIWKNQSLFSCLPWWCSCCSHAIHDVTHPVTLTAKCPKRNNLQNRSSYQTKERCWYTNIFFLFEKPLEILTLLHIHRLIVLSFSHFIVWASLAKTSSPPSTSSTWSTDMFPSKGPERILLLAAHSTTRKLRLSWSPQANRFSNASAAAKAGTSLPSCRRSKG